MIGAVLIFAAVLQGWSHVEDPCSMGLDFGRTLLWQHCRTQAAGNGPASMPPQEVLPQVRRFGVDFTAIRTPVYDPRAERLADAYRRID